MYLNALFKAKRLLRFFTAKTFRVMQLTTIVLLATCLQVSAFSYAQEVNISGKDLSLQKIFKEIRKQTGYNFIYTNEELKQASAVTLHEKNAGLKEVLDICFARQPLTYKIDDKIIIVQPKAAGPDAVIFSLVKGRVTDQSNGAALPGVTVQVKGSNMGTVTDKNGDFSIQAPDNTVLVVSYIGYDRTEVQVNGQSVVNIALKPSNTGLNEVVVVGYGTQKKIDLTGSVSTITSKELESRPTTNLSSSLAGLAAGMYVRQSSGTPGSDGASITIRGIGTLSSTSVLVLVDGVISSMDAVNPADVESITVLKDAASASIYGALAANGVILITTKKGHNGKPTVTYSGTFSSTNPTGLPKFVTNSARYMQLMN